MGKFVVDANVAIKWVLPEIHTDIALRLLDDDDNILLVPDCVYLALAVTNSCQMVTADERFFNALSSDSLASSVCWIEDLS